MKLRCFASHILFAFVTFSEARGATYYVAPTGKNTNDGSIQTPWRTIQHASNSVSAGDTVEIRAGVYNEVVTVMHSGSVAAGYITFENYPGETVTLDGTGLPIPNNQFGLITIQNRNYITVSGLEIRNYKTSTTANVPIGIFITGADSHIRILNNHIHNIETSAKGCNANALGLAVYGSKAPASIHNLTISGNEVDHLITGCSESLTLNGNVQHWTVTDNVVHDNNNIGIDAIGFEKTSPQPAYDQARDGIISGNTVYNITSYGNPAYGKQYAADGIYIDGGTRITVERNAIYNTDIALEMASEHSTRVTSHVTARSNLIYHSNSAGISIGGYASNVGGTDHCIAVNNTLFENDAKNTGSGEFQIQFYATNNVFKNNIVYATKQGLFIHNFTKTEANPADVDYNDYFYTGGAPNGQWEWNGKIYTGYAAYRGATGKDPNSPFGDPQFFSLSMPDLHVALTSPARNAGISLGAAVVGTEDYSGNSRVEGPNIDIGAYEQP